LKVILANINVLDWSLSTNKDYGKSFTTPFGPNQQFPIPPLDLSPSDTGLSYSFGDIASLGIGIKITPDIGSKTITTDWSASGDSIGSGSLTYSDPGTSYNFGPVTAGDYSPTTDYANIRLSNFKYFFDIFNIDVSAKYSIRYLWRFGRNRNSKSRSI